MKLYYSTTSPFARKVRVAIHELGVSEKVEFIRINPFSDEKKLAGLNPLGQIPVLELEDGNTLFDSRVIVEYLYNCAGREIVPKQYSNRSNDYFEFQKFYAIANGIMENAVAWAVEKRRPEELQSSVWCERWMNSILQSIDYLGQGEKDFYKPSCLAAQTLAIALDYLDFRHATLNWREKNIRFMTRLQPIYLRPSFLETGFYE